MFLGHFSAALASKRITPRPSLGWLFAACQWPDLVWPIFSLIGMEHFRIDPGNTAFTPLAFDYYPWSHSLLMVCVWGAAVGLVYLGRHGDRRGAYLLAALVVSHWVLDWVTHRPDMPILGNNDYLVGLGLWNSVAATITVETLMYLFAIWVYVRHTLPRDRVGFWGFWALVILLAMISVANVISPPPPSTMAVKIGALGLWLFIPFAAWVDKHRAPR